MQWTFVTRPIAILLAALKPLRTFLLIATAVTTAACSDLVGETPIETTGTSREESTTSTRDRRCGRPATGGTGDVDTGTPASDALFLSGEQFVCADDVVVVGEEDLNEVAVAAQLAAALEGPLLLPDPRLAAEIGRLKPRRVHLVGQVEVDTPPDADVNALDIPSSVEMAREALEVDSEVQLPAVPDASTIIETAGAIVARDRVVAPQLASSSGTTTPTVRAALQVQDVVVGLAGISPAENVWLVEGSDTVTILLASAMGRSVDASPVAVDPSDILGYPQVGAALSGGSPASLRFVGMSPTASDWELAVLSNGAQVPGGGFHVLPNGVKRRYVAFYGHPETTALGVLGEQGPEATLQRMQPFLEAYTGDGSQVVPTFEMIASVASAVATEDSDYSYEWPVSTFENWVETARENNAYVILDLQPGRDDFLSQAMLYEDLLRLPFVGLALDPEWRLGPNQVHLQQVGRVEASEVNQVIHWLADLVRDNGLPQKMLIVHQFRTTMIQNREILEQRPELQLIVQMDGDGLEAQKDTTFQIITQGAEDAFWSWGWKNFFDEDEPGPPTPESTMDKTPTPVYVSYQ